MWRASCMAAISIAYLTATANSSSLSLQLNLSAPQHVHAAAFLGVNIDTASLYQKTAPHRLDLADPGLRALAKAFGGAGVPGSTLRVGGSAADDTAALGVDAATPWGASSILMDEAYWDELVAFAADAGLALAWDLNMRQRNADDTTVWNGTISEILLRHVVAKRQRVSAFQLGNEPGHWAAETYNAPGAAAHGKDFVALKQQLAAAFPDEKERPKIQGPDACFGEFLNCSKVNCTNGGQKCASLEYLKELLVAADGAIDVVTVHSYGLWGQTNGVPFTGQCNAASFTSPALWERDSPGKPGRPHAWSGRMGMVNLLGKWRNTQQQHAPLSKIALSETASAADGGCVNLSNTFAAGFFWVDQLGLVAEAGFDQVFRQDFVGFSGINGGSSYALAGAPGWVGGGGNATASDVSSSSGPCPLPPYCKPSPTGPLHAHPDFFTSLLWKRLMGRRVIESSLGAAALMDSGGNGDSGDGVRVYASCADGSDSTVVLAWLNPGAIPVTVALPAELATAERMGWSLTSGGAGGELDAAAVRLNNASSALSNANAIRAGEMAGEAQMESGELALAAKSYGFTQFKQVVGATACA